jgi:hypothetical protein
MTNCPLARGLHKRRRAWLDVLASFRLSLASTFGFLLLFLGFWLRFPSFLASLRLASRFASLGLVCRIASFDSLA